MSKFKQSIGNLCFLILFILSCSEPLKPIEDRLSLEELEAMKSSSSILSGSSGEGASSSGSSSSVVLCGETYTEAQFCRNGTVYDKCGNSEGLGKYDYDPDTHFCRNNYTIAKCNGKEYNPPYERCSYGSVEKQCGNAWFNIQTYFCLGGAVTQLCGGLPYTSSQFCSTNTVYNKCGGTVTFTPGTEECCGNDKYTLTTHYCRTADNTIHSCGNKPLNPDIQFCYNDSKIGNYCGTRTEIFDPDLYECKPDININGIYLKMPVSYEEQSYNAVLIGTQIWMTKNLNINVPGSKCYGEDSQVYDEENDNFITLPNDEVQANCAKYGRLYDWSTAMDFSSYCNTNSCSSDIQSKYQGICPSGWHIPNDAEWTTLTDYVGGGNTAGTKLKSTTNWNTSSSYMPGTDNYGFSALPGGQFGNYFIGAGNFGNWWSSFSDYNNSAYYRSMSYAGPNVGCCSTYKSFLYSVRCVKD